jgi:hypothetical protein
MTLSAPIRPVAVDVLGVHPSDPQSLVVEVHLSSTPPPRWSDLFAVLSGELLDARSSRTSLDGPVVVLTSRDHDMERQLESVQRLIRHTNARMSAEHEPALVTRPISVAARATAPAPARVSAPAPVTAPAPAWPPRTVRVSQAITQDSMSADIRQRLERAKRRAHAMTGVFQSSHWEVLETTPLETLLPDAMPATAPTAPGGHVSSLTAIAQMDGPTAADARSTFASTQVNDQTGGQ